MGKRHGLGSYRGDPCRQVLEPRSNLIAERRYAEQDHHGNRRNQDAVLDQVLTSLVGSVVKHENVLARSTAAPNLDASLRSVRAQSTRKGDRLHQCGFLPNDI